MKLSCWRAGFALERRAAGLSAAGGLFLEEHLTSCESCRAAANLLTGLRTLHTSELPTLSVAQREHAIAAALDHVPRAQTHATTALGVGTAAWLMPLAVVALLIFVGLRTYRGDQATARVTPSTKTAAVKPRDRLLSGDLESAGVALAVGQPLPSHEPLHTRGGAVLALAHANVELRANGRAHWQASRHELQVLAGSVVVDVDPAPHAPFVVTTARFNVLVLGTRFEVSLTGVKVLRGRVQVVAPDGTALARLDASQSWQLAVADAPQPLPSDNPSRSTGKTPAPQPDALLEQARNQLAEHDIASARRTLQQALALPVSQTQRAEALSLRAECALVSGDAAGARNGYLTVAEHFSALPAGQTALFAAARIEAEHGDKTLAARLLARYLRRYPQGHFAKEAAARSKALGVASTPP